MHFSQFVEDEGGTTSYGLCSSSSTDHMWGGRRKKARTYVLLCSLSKIILNNLKKNATSGSIHVYNDIPLKITV